MTPTIVFDVNETLLDLSPIKEWFSVRFGDQPTAAAWFAELLRLSFVSSVTDRYTPFPDLAPPSLATVAEGVGIEVTRDDANRIREIFMTLPPHTEVASSLDRLAAAGFRIAALTNSPQSTAERQLDQAGIADRFDLVLSVDMVRRFKPHRSVYLAAAEKLGTAPASCVMVAGHDWDIAGAMAAGFHGVFVARSGASYSSAFPAPTATVDDISEAVTLIADRFGG